VRRDRAGGGTEGGREGQMEGRRDGGTEGGTDGGTRGATEGEVLIFLTRVFGSSLHRLGARGIGLLRLLVAAVRLPVAAVAYSLQEPARARARADPGRIPCWPKTGGRRRPHGTICSLPCDDGPPVTAWCFGRGRLGFGTSRSWQLARCGAACCDCLLQQRREAQGSLAAAFSSHQQR
jgi:hypothetical protein